MLGWILQKLLAGILTLWLVMTLTFVLLRLLPGGPFDQERRVPPAIQANLEAHYHLNEPLLHQYGYYTLGLLGGDLGPSYKYRTRRVGDIITDAFGVSLLIGVPALLLGTMGGILLGAWAGLSNRRWVEGLLSALGVVSLSLPAFIWGGLLIGVFAIGLGWLPAATLSTPRHVVLPTLTLAIVPFAYAFFLVRSSTGQTRQAAFVRVKRTYGLGETAVAIRHVLRNSLVPLLSILGPIAAALITGSFAVETIFAVPGLGRHFISAVSNRDYTLVMGITLVYSALLIVFNTLSDLLYGVLDPRLRRTEASS